MALDAHAKRAKKGVEVKNKNYDLVYADPPWQVIKTIRKVRPNQKRNLDYPTLPLGEIKEIMEDYDSDILFIWTTDKFLFKSENLGKELGYTLHTRIIWNKENGMCPAFTIRFAHEYLLWFYKKGKLMPIAKEATGKFTSVITEKPIRHSAKPLKAYELIETLYPNHSKIELFARNKRDGWDSWGNEV